VWRYIRNLQIGEAFLAKYQGKYSTEGAGEQLTQTKEIPWHKSLDQDAKDTAGADHGLLAGHSTRP